MSKCYKCKKEIDWIRMQSGKSMPVNPVQVLLKIDKAGKDRAVHPDGFVATGTIVTDWKDASFLGYVPHWATCPYAEEYRTAIRRASDIRKKPVPQESDETDAGREPEEEYEQMEL